MTTASSGSSMATISYGKRSRIRRLAPVSPAFLGRGDRGMKFSSIMSMAASTAAKNSAPSPSCSNSYHAAASMASCEASSSILTGSHFYRPILARIFDRNSSRLSSVALPLLTLAARRIISSCQACSAESSRGPSKLIMSSRANVARSDSERVEI